MDVEKSFPTVPPVKESGWGNVQRQEDGIPWSVRAFVFFLWPHLSGPLLSTLSAVTVSALSTGNEDHPSPYP